jgi:hypothetical protein
MGSQAIPLARQLAPDVVQAQGELSKRQRFLLLAGMDDVKTGG